MTSFTHYCPRRTRCWLARGGGRKTRCGRDGRCRNLAGVFRFAVSAARALGRAAMTAALALLSPAAPSALSSVLSPASLASALNGARP
jgi:hypothetical protein